MLALVGVMDLVAAWLPKRTALAAVARFARCSAHFRSYLAASCATTEDRCFACDEEVRCDVRRHWHVRGQGGRGAFVVYQGAYDASRYVWLPADGRVACWSCARRLGVRPAAWRRKAVRQEIAEEMWERFRELSLAPVVHKGRGGSATGGRGCSSSHYAGRRPELHRLCARLATRRLANQQSMKQCLVVRRVSFDDPRGDARRATRRVPRNDEGRRLFLGVL